MNPSTFVLAETQTIESVDALRNSLLAASALPGPLCVDASRVEIIDTAALQLLAALWRAAAATKSPPRLESPSPAFQRAAVLLGLNRLFDGAG